MARVIESRVSRLADRQHAFELRTANVDYYVGEDPNFGGKENGAAAHPLETGLGMEYAKSWESAIRLALLPLTNSNTGRAPAPASSSPSPTPSNAPVPLSLSLSPFGA